MDFLIRRIFILRPDNLGDLVLFSGSLRFIRKHWPKAKITLCVRHFGVELFRNCPYVDNLVLYESLINDLTAEGRLNWMPKIKGSDRIGSWFRKKIPIIAFWKYRSDIALLPVVSPMPEYHGIMLRIPSPKKISMFGNHCNQTPEMDKIVRSWYTKQMDVSNMPWDYPELSANKRFLEFIGINLPNVEIHPELWTTDDDERWAKNRIPIHGDHLILGVAPSKASNLKHNLPSEWWHNVLKSISHKKVILVLIGSGQDRNVCEGIQNILNNSDNPHQVINLCSITSIGQSIECMRLCDALICQDTAALHMAVALKKPVLGIVGGGHFGRFFPWGDSSKTKVLHKNMDCYGCNWQCKYETLRCIQELEPSSAINLFNELKII